MGNSKKKLNERGKKKKMLNAKLKRHLARPHALPQGISAYIYIYIYTYKYINIYIYIYIDDYSFITSNH